MFKQKMAWRTAFLNMEQLIIGGQIVNGNNRYLRFTRINITNAVYNMEQLEIPEAQEVPHLALQQFLLSARTLKTGCTFAADTIPNALLRGKRRQKNA